MNYYIETYTGKHFYLEKPSKHEICIEDIAYSLAHTYRFGGHSKPAITVAEHCVHMARRVPEDPLVALHLLMHDAGEAYYGDIPTPLKRLMDENHDSYTIFRTRVDNAINMAFGLYYTEKISTVVHKLDREALFWEAYHCMPSKGKSLKHQPTTVHLEENWPAPDCWDQDTAMQFFLSNYHSFKALIVR